MAIQMTGNLIERRTGIMANKLYEQQMQNSNPFMAQMNTMNQMAEMQKNPLQFLAAKGLNIPQQYANDPRGAVQYLMNNGQMNQGMLNQLIQRAQMMGYKF